MDPDHRDRLLYVINCILVVTPNFPGDKKLNKLNYLRRRVGDHRILYEVDYDRSMLYIVDVILRNEGYKQTMRKCHSFADI